MGRNLRCIQKLLGYGGSKTTERYMQVSTQEIENIVNPLDIYYRQESGTIHTNKVNIVPLKQRDKGNKDHIGVHTQ